MDIIEEIKKLQNENDVLKYFIADRNRFNGDNIDYKEKLRKKNKLFTQILDELHSSRDVITGLNTKIEELEKRDLDRRHELSDLKREKEKNFWDKSKFEKSLNDAINETNQLRQKHEEEREKIAEIIGYTYEVCRDCYYSID